MPEQEHGHGRPEKQEKDEKGWDEKEEKGRDEKRRRDPISRVTSGLILIGIGILFLLTTQDKIAWADWWAYLLLVLGGIFIFEVLLRSFTPAYRRHVFGRLIAGVVLVIIGAAHLYGFVTWWPLIIIGVGAVILLSALFGRRK
jgi:cation transport ATPase